MEDEILINTLQLHETQILSMRRELNGVHAGLTGIEGRVNKTRLVMVIAGILFVVVAVWLWMK